MMNRSEARRTIEDLKVLHTVLEPDLRDVYVEGRRDKRLLDWYFRETGLPVTGVYAIDDRVEVPSNLAFEAGGEVGARGRVLGLAASLNEFGGVFSGITCVIDLDRDCLFAGPDHAALLRTDFGSMEGYLFQPGPLGKLLELGLGLSADPEELISETIPVLNELFLVRAALHIHGPEVPLIRRFMNCCQLRAGEWTVDTSELVSRSLATKGLVSRREHVLTRLEMFRESMPEDRRCAVRGHDIAPVLAATLGLENELAKPEALERMWLPCLVPEDLRDYPLFENLRARLT